MLKKILLAFAALGGLVLLIGLVLPSKFRVERSTTINAPPEAVYASVANVQRWQDWSSWNVKTYPGIRWVFGGTAVGVGAVRSWSGEDVGRGTLSLTEADPKTGVAYDTSVEQGRYLMHGRISLAAVESGTRVTWVDEGDIGGNPFAHYAVPFIKSRLGAHLEEGLANLKKQLESGPPLAIEAPPVPASASPGEQVAAPAQPPASEQPPPAPLVEGTPPATGSTDGTQVIPPEGSQAAAPGEVAPTPSATTPPSGEQAPASPGVVAPPVEPAPSQPASSGEPVLAPTSTPAPAVDAGSAELKRAG
ncbi:SRPBCC family protein [Archangium lipolyticum]|uniref:SRPBCC family protein n=1 Tax=Archangium lipolyticum TaxID=2970465 RepID=UPI00214A2BEF|nr:SRPBCC family protein [Archangium lipolyticum]